MKNGIDYSLPIAQRIHVERSVKIETSKIHPNNWNANFLTPKAQKALGGSMDLFTQVAEILVRPHPFIESEYEIIDGEHRYIENPEHLLCHVITGLTDEEYQLLTHASHGYGEHEPVKLSKSLRDIEAALGDRTYLPIPFTSADIDKMLEVANKDLPPEATDEFTRMVFSVPTDAVDIVRAALEKVMQEGNIQGENYNVKAGRALEYLCADYYGG
jgi:hypothetical protein